MCSLSPTSERRAAEAAGKSATVPRPSFAKNIGAALFPTSICARRRRGTFLKSDLAYAANLFLHCEFLHPKHSPTRSPAALFPPYLNRTEKALPRKCLLFFFESAAAVSKRCQHLTRIVKTSRALSANCHTPEKHRLSAFVRSPFQQSILHRIRKMNQR